MSTMEAHARATDAARRWQRDYLRKVDLDHDHLGYWHAKASGPHPADPRLSIVTRANAPSSQAANELALAEWRAAAYRWFVLPPDAQTLALPGLFRAERWRQGITGAAVVREVLRSEGHDPIDRMRVMAMGIACEGRLGGACTVGDVVDALLHPPAPAPAPATGWTPTGDGDQLQLAC